MWHLLITDLGDYDVAVHEYAVRLGLQTAMIRAKPCLRDGCLAGSQLLQVARPCQGQQRGRLYMSSLWDGPERRSKAERSTHFLDPGVQKLSIAMVPECWIKLYGRNLSHGQHSCRCQGDQEVQHLHISQASASARSQQFSVGNKLHAAQTLKLMTLVFQYWQVSKYISRVAHLLHRRGFQSHYHRSD